MFWWQIQPLINAPDPALHITKTHQPWPERRLSLTDLGNVILEGRRTWLEHAPAERWVGFDSFQASDRGWQEQSDEISVAMP